MTKVAINGFGRIGRLVFKIGLEKGVNFVAINDLTDIPTLAYLLKYDSAYGKYNKKVEVGKDFLKVNGKNVLGPKDDPYSPMTCSVKRAVELGAKAIGFTNFPGSKYQDRITEDFRLVQEEAHDFGLVVAAPGDLLENDGALALELRRDDVTCLKSP